jgi:predicted patatin/cPLA2 family phospholipase
MLAGHQPHDVLELIRARKATGSRADGRKLGLVVEGGAMRGVYTAGALLGFDLMGMNDVFDVAYGTSAGVINTAHFLSLAGAPKTATYYRALADGRFYNPWRVWKMVNVDFLLNDVLQGEFPLDLAAAQKSATPFYIAYLDHRTAQVKYALLQEAGNQTWNLIKAAVAMPVVYRPHVFYDGHRCLDAGVAESYALPRAIDDGCTDILVLLSRNLESGYHHRSRYEKILFRQFAARRSPALMKAFENGVHEMRRLDEISSGKVSAGPRIATFSPNPDPVKGSTMDVRLLREATLQMTAEILESFSHSHARPEELKASAIL